MTKPNLNLLKLQLQKMLGRPVETETLRSGKFICKYLEYGMTPLALVGETEEEAYQKLHQYLSAKKKPEPDGPAAA